MIAHVDLSGENERKIRKLVKDAKLDMVNVYNVANVAIQIGLPAVRKLLVAPKTTTKRKNK